uniref:Uncharacterized protein n=1 Tax=Arundo donax TaxID=35708 RepID=A0A0A9HJ01_ARUDO
MVAKTMATLKKRSAVAQTCCNPTSFCRIFSMMKVDTIFESSLPVSMICKHRGMISLCSRKLIIPVSSALARAPITLRVVKRRYSKGPAVLVVPKNGYKYRGILAFMKEVLVQGCDATV